MCDAVQMLVHASEQNLAALAMCVNVKKYEERARGGKYQLELKWLCRLEEQIMQIGSGPHSQISPTLGRPACTPIESNLI